MTDRLITEHTTGTVIATDGTPTEKPTRILSSEEAQILRGYFYWALKAQLEPELACGDCFDFTRGSKATYEITEQQIVIICGCAIRFFQGPSVLPTFDYLAFTGPMDAERILHVKLPSTVALLLRQYKKVLQALNLKEMLRCNACYALLGSGADGCDAQVLSYSIVIRCRCSKRTFQGLSV